ncbi:MAG: hypothetical protein OEW62_09880 [Candidatus Bathyarchaeota archaeon]|nr:hypothetical protein [Candidatus Bathyarchaeota archaeon]
MNGILELRESVKELPYFSSQMLKKYGYIIVLDPPELRKHPPKEVDC